MVLKIDHSKQTEIVYPDSDGQPIADNTLQFRWLTTIKENLEWLFADNDQIFVAGDLLWYPVEGDNKIRQAPDIMVVFGRPKNDRGSYQQWLEDNIPPQVVFEILSPGNRQGEMNRKLLFYQKYGVEEYYLYDPQRLDLSGLIRVEAELVPIEEMLGWVSPRLQIRFEIDTELKLYHPNGDLFSTYTEVKQRADKLAAKLRELGLNPDEIS